MASTLFCFAELAKNPDIQQKVQKEIDEVLNSRELTYETLNDLKYLECCIDETLRKYPVAPILARTCNEDFEIPGTHLVIEKGKLLMISVLGLHRDPEIYEDPMKFKPERFLNSPNGTNKANGLFYLPFGDGPRYCIGMKLAKFIMKVGVLSVLSKFSVEFDDKTMVDSELELEKVQFILSLQHPLKLKLSPRIKD